MWKKPERTYAVSEPGGERGEVLELVEYTESWLRECEYPYWKKYYRGEDDSFDTFLSAWIVENNAFVLYEGDDYEFEEDRYIEFDDGA
jgi:hypothetical protein